MDKLQYPQVNGKNYGKTSSVEGHLKRLGYI